MVVKRITNNEIPSELYHHGIKGQKWGVRRYQNPDGSLTSAGQARYNPGSTLNNGKRLKVKTKVVDKNGKTIIKNTAKNSLGKEKSKEIVKDNKSTVKTKTTLKNGKNITISKSALKKAAIAVGIAAGVGLAVGIYKYRKNIAAKTLMDTTLTKAKFQRIQAGNGDFIKNDFSAYASYELGDKMIYSGRHSKLVQRFAKIEGKDPTIYSVKLMNRKNINVPSIQKTQSIISDTIATDTKFKSALMDGISDSIHRLNSKPARLTLGEKRRFKTLVKARDSLIRDSSDIKHITDAWNITLTNKNTNWDEYGKVFKKIKKMGYNAVWDTNDMYTGGYQAKSPIIILDRNALEKASDKILNNDSIRKRNRVSNSLIAERNLLAAGNSIINAFSKVKVGYY